MWYALSLYYACIQSLGVIFIPWATFVPNFVSFAASIAELAHGEKARTQSLNHSPSLFDAPGTEAFASEYAVSISSINTCLMAVRCCWHVQCMCLLRGRTYSQMMSTMMKMMTAWHSLQVTVSCNTLRVTITECNICLICGRDEETKDPEWNATVVNWLFAQITHVVAAPCGFACVVISQKQLYIPSFIEIPSRVSEPVGVKICLPTHLDSGWFNSLYYRTSCN